MTNIECFNVYFGDTIRVMSDDLGWIKREAIPFHSRFYITAPFVLPVKAKE